MKIHNIGFTILILLAVTGTCLAFQESTSIVAASSMAADGLDLNAVSELFKEAENLEEFEKALNDTELGINNIDLDSDGYVDYLRVVEQVAENTHVIIVQVQLSEDEYQDVATIEIEKTEDDSYNMQVHGNEVIYGYDYYVAPTHVHIHNWPIIPWMFRPHYRPYRSVYYFGVYPRWWRPWRPVHVNVYRTRTVHYTRRATFKVTTTSRVRTVHKVNYKPRTSTKVVVKTKHRNTKTTGRKTGGTLKTVHKTPSGKTTTVKRAGGKVTNPKTGVTKKGGVSVRRTTNPKTGKTTTVRHGAKKVTNPKTGKTKTTHVKSKKVKNNKGVKKAGKKRTHKSGKGGAKRKGRKKGKK